MTDQEKQQAYDKGWYIFKPSPCSTRYWTREDWIRYIDTNDGWRIPQEDTHEAHTT